MYTYKPIDFLITDGTHIQSVSPPNVRPSLPSHVVGGVSAKCCVLPKHGFLPLLFDHGHS